VSGGSVQKGVRWVLQPSICDGDVTERDKKGVVVSHCLL